VVYIGGNLQPHIRRTHVESVRKISGAKAGKNNRKMDKLHHCTFQQSVLLSNCGRYGEACDM